MTRYCQQLLKTVAPVTKSWNNDLNSEWISRIYFAAKMILGASVMAESLEFAEEKNLRIVIPYLDYYTVLHVLRAIILTNPNVPWNNGELLSTTHAKTINLAVDILRKFDKEVATEAKKHITHLKAFRELISYRAPSSGDSFPNANVDVLDICRLFAEIAQLQSELVESSIQKNAIGKFSLEPNAINRICRMEIDGVAFFDKEDYYRMDYLRRKYPLPTNILHIMSEGHVEDFFGSWCSEDEGKNQFNPDSDWRILFDVP